MKTEDIIEAVKDGTFANKFIVPSDFNAYEVISIADMSILNILAENRDKFLVLSKTESWVKNSVRQLILGEMDKFNAYLKGISEGACWCTKYRYFKLNPEREEKMGFVNILETIEYNAYCEFSYKCQCSQCGTIYQCHSHESGFGIAYVWIKE